MSARAPITVVLVFAVAAVLFYSARVSTSEISFGPFPFDATTFTYSGTWLFVWRSASNAYFGVSAATFGTATSYFTGDFVRLPDDWNGKITVDGNTYTYREMATRNFFDVLAMVWGAVMIMVMVLLVLFGGDERTIVFTAFALLIISLFVLPFPIMNHLKTSGDIIVHDKPAYVHFPYFVFVDHLTSAVVQDDGVSTEYLMKFSDNIIYTPYAYGGTNTFLRAHPRYL